MDRGEKYSCMEMWTGGEVLVMERGKGGEVLDREKRQPSFLRTTTVRATAPHIPTTAATRNRPVNPPSPRASTCPPTLAPIIALASAAA